METSGGREYQHDGKALDGEGCDVCGKQGDLYSFEWNEEGLGEFNGYMVACEVHVQSRVDFWERVYCKRERLNVYAE